MITKKEDLHNTYIVNDHGELRSLYLKACCKFGLHKYMDGDDSFLDDFYDTAIIQCDECSLPDSEGILQRGTDIDESFTEISMSDLIPQTKEVEWKNGLPPIGEECEVSNCGNSWIKAKVLFMGTGLCVVNHGYGEQHYHLNSVKFRKPETPEAKKEREELESAYSLYLKIQGKMHNVEGYSLDSFKADVCAVSYWLAIVKETGYKVEK